MAFLDAVHRLAIDIKNCKVELGLARILGSRDQIVELYYDQRFQRRLFNVFVDDMHTM